MKIFDLTIPFVTIVFLLSSCNDKELLAENTDSSLLTINNVENARSVLDYTTIMKETPGLGELSADDFYLGDSSSTNSIVELNAFLWKPDIFQGQPLYGDWTIPYRQIFIANSVLAAVPKLSGDKKEIEQIKGCAKFYRAYALFGIVLEFANLYSSNAATDLGVPIRLSPDPEERSSRATVEATYNQIIDDVKQALLILPGSIDNSRKNRPAKATGYALLARVYLTMADYAQAKLYSDSCLQLHSALIDYNNVSANSPLPFTGNNNEVIYQSNLLSSITLFYNDTYFVDSTLYNTYGAMDLRKEIYFSVNSQGKALLKPGYSGSGVRFSGLATDEVLLIRAESNARIGNKEDAMTDLNNLLVKRWKSGTFVPLTAGSATEALELILVERRKSLVGRGLRWIDIRRFNRENRGVGLKRLMNGKEYTLPAGDNRFVLPIPPDVISSVQGMPQNPRSI